MPTINPPLAPIEPVTEVLHGVAIVDPYRWLEEQQSPRTREWIAEQASYIRQHLDTIPGRAALRKRVEALLAVDSCSAPRKAGERCFFLKREAHREQPVLAMCEGGSNEDIALLDPVQLTGSPQAAVNILAMSRDGRLLAFIARGSGEDYAPIRFLDVDRREVLPDSLPAGICGGVVFSENGTSFYYTHRARNSPRPYYQAVFRHTLGTPFAEDSEIFFLDESPNLRLIFAATRGSRFFLYRAITLEDPTSSDFYIHHLESGQAPKKVLENIAGIFFPFFVGEQLFAYTDFQAPNRRIVVIDLENPNPAHWRTVVAERNVPMVQFAVMDDLLCLVYLEDLAHRILISDLKGMIREELATPTRGSIQLCWQPEPTDMLFYEFSSFSHPPVTFQYRHGTKARELSGCNVRHPISGVEVKKIRYPAKDGTLIPMFLVSKGRAAGAGPVFLTAYGGFGKSLTPQFSAYSTVLMELGCVFAVANVRGGEEFGKEWHEAAKRRKRQTAIDDFLSAAQWLLAEKIATPGRLAIGGGSNAGLLVGAALTQRPELFCAVLCLGPLLDMLRYHKFDEARHWIDEFGSAEFSDDFQVLHSYSPYHRVRNDVAYPAVMFISGDADTRCNPMHTRKMAARLQAASTSDRPILLDYKPAWGHIPVQPLSMRIEALTDRLLFLCHQLDVTIPEAWP